MAVWWMAGVPVPGVIVVWSALSALTAYTKQIHVKLDKGTVHGG